MRSKAEPMAANWPCSIDSVATQMDNYGNNGSVRRLVRFVCFNDFILKTKWTQNRLCSPKSLKTITFSINLLFFSQCNVNAMITSQTSFQCFRQQIMKNEKFDHKSNVIPMFESFRRLFATRSQLLANWRISGNPVAGKPSVRLLLCMTLNVLIFSEFTLLTEI